MPPQIPGCANCRPQELPVVDCEGSEALRATICGAVDIGPIAVQFPTVICEGEDALRASICGPVDAGIPIVDCEGSDAVRSTICGPVDVTVIGGGPRQHAEDSPHVSGDIGDFALGVRNDAGDILTSANGDYSPIATDSAGRVGIADLGGSITVDGSVTLGAIPTGGLSTYKNIDVNAGGHLIKGSPGRLYVLHAINRSNFERFLKLYNKATAPVVGTDIPVMTISLGGTAGNADNDFEMSTDIGFAFSLGIGVAATTGIADSNTGATSVNDVVVTIGFA